MTLLFFLLYFIGLSLPGLAAHRLLNLRTDQFISVIAISYSIFTINFVGSNYLGITPNKLLIALALALVVSLGILLNRNKPRIISYKDYCVPVLGLSLISLVYQFTVGPFNEVPADLYSHLERYQFALKNIKSDSLGPSLHPSELLLQGSGVFYHLLACINFIAPVSTIELVNIIDFSNRTIFLIASYFFTRSIFKENPNRASIASVATLFVFLHFGISIFAYSRYYTLAPTMLNMVLYMFGILSVLHIFNNKLSLNSVGHYLVIGLVVICAAAIHVQEAMYILVMTACLAACAAIASVHKRIRFPIVATRQVWVIAATALLGFGFAYFYSSQNMARAPNAHWRLWDFGPGVWPLPQLTVLNLGKEFAQVITLWGALVYLLFLLNIKRYKDNLFVIAAMFSPVFTILNPFFVDLFLRHYNSTTLWRLCYLIPIHMVAADLFLHYVKQVRSTQGLKRALYAVPIVSLTLLLTPYKNTWGGWHFSRTPSLTKSDRSLSAYGYKDLLDFLDTIESQKTILTDPMTGYMVSGMTKHYSPRRKFFRDHKFIHFSFNDYSDNPLDRHSGKLLIVNSRPASNSRVGELSNHWQKEQWLTSRYYYPIELLEHIKKRDEKFKLRWSQNEVSVYEIR